jgi:hypothetical protein
LVIGNFGQEHKYNKYVKPNCNNVYDKKLHFLFVLLGYENPIPPGDRESRVNAINKAGFIELASQGQAPTQTHRSDWADKTPSLFREDFI